VVDSTEAPVIEDALQLIGGKAVINSINLEDGEERIKRVIPLCRRYGAAVIALTIDEQGMAKTAEKKLAVATRIYDLVVGRYGMQPHDLIFDALTFTLGSGDEEFRRAGIETIEAIRLIKKELPGVKTLLGVSNISFGLSPAMRHPLNRVFLHYAIEAGLDMAIVHAARIMPLYKIDEKGRELCRQVVFDERTFEDILEGGKPQKRTVTDPLKDLMAYYATQSGEKKEKIVEGLTVEERLKNRIVDGDKVGLQADLEEARKTHAPLEIINTILLDGMKVVGELFGSGQMQLPFVLQSAEVMKTAVAHLEQYMDKVDSASKGIMVLATVKGDVHDIGKNLVDIILTNNGYRVINLGIKVPVESMIHAAQEHGADAIGMSGLLVKSTLIMKQNLEVLNEQGITIPVILGGAALTRRYVEDDLRQVYKGSVFYANDAFDGLAFMGKIGAGDLATTTGGGDDGGEEESLTGTEAKIALAVSEDQRYKERQSPATGDARRSKVRRDAPIPKPPFWGTKILDSLSLGEVFHFVNEVALIRGQWQVRKGKLADAAYQEMLREKVYPEYEALKAKAAREKLLQPKAVYGYFPCQAEGDDLIVYESDGATVRTRFTFPRQKNDRYLCLADYFAPVDSGRMDVAAFHLVTMGSVASEHSAKLFSGGNYKDYLYFHGLSVESAEALAELIHKRIREELGIAGKDAPDVRRLFSQGYQGARYSFGYPACPNLEDQTKLFDLLEGERIGVHLTDEYSLEPEQSTNAIIVHHPEARYFNIS
jgi:5-methyltetrahydrofolate--homocysteine methyltransferase